MPMARCGHSNTRLTDLPLYGYVWDAAYGTEWIHLEGSMHPWDTLKTCSGVCQCIKSKLSMIPVKALRALRSMFTGEVRTLEMAIGTVDE
jgi:hypothetical protein